MPLLAFVGALAGVALTYGLGAVGGRVRTTTALILAGVAVTAFLTALQTYVLQQNVETIREVYSFILGSLATAGWHEVRLLAAVRGGRGRRGAGAAARARRALGRRRRGDQPRPASAAVRGYILVAAASLGTAAAVSVSGLIGFVGIIVPHTVRLLAGSSHRVDPAAVGAVRRAPSWRCATWSPGPRCRPTEIPIGVVTAFFGAPFFIVVLRTATGG